MDADKRSAAKNTVTVTVDRAIGTCHPEYPDMRLPYQLWFIKVLWRLMGKNRTLTS